MVSIKTKSVPMFLLIVSVALVAIVGLLKLFHVVWCWVLPQLWATGPANVISPSFMLFVGMWFITTVLLNIIRGDKK